MQTDQYTTVATVLAHLQLTTADDQLTSRITSLIQGVSRQIDMYCRRRFYPVTQTRRYDTPKPTRSGPGMLLLDDDLLSVTSLIDGDGQIIESADYVLCPVNTPIKRWIELHGTAGRSPWWGASVRPRGAIQVTGTWGYDTLESDAIVHEAAVLWVAMLVRQANDTGIQSKSIGDFSVSYTSFQDRRVQAPSGQTVFLPPGDVALRLESLRYRCIAAVA